MTYKFDFGVLLPYWQQLLYGCWLTIVLATLAIVVGLAIGIVTALAKQSRHVLRGINSEYALPGASLFHLFRAAGLGH